VSCIGVLGKVAIAECAVAFNQQINAVVVDHEEMVPEFLFLQIMGPRFQSAIQAASSGTTVPIVNKSRFCDLAIVAPPLSQQHVIVKRLTQIRQGFALMRQIQLNKNTALDELKASLLHQAFTGQL
jgi:type I restriction enzyme S subunit